jgi:hypothetical protein
MAIEPKQVTSGDIENMVGARLEDLFAGKGQDVERFAPAVARGGPDLSGITTRGIRGIFYDALELAASTSWAQAVGLYLASDTRTETHKWLGSVPEPRAHIGGLNKVPVILNTLSVTNQDYEITLPFSTHDQMWDQVGHISRRVGEMSMAWADHWNKLSVDVLEANTTAYDSVALFSGSHTFGDSGTLDNDLASGDVASLGVTTTTRPTKAEAGAILADLAAYMYRYTDSSGRPANQAAKRFMVLCPPSMLPGFQSAIHDRLYVSGGSNALANLGQSFVAVAEPRLAATDECYMIRLDGPSSKALILQEAKSPELQVVGPQSEHAIKNNEVLFVSKACRAVAPGEFRHIIRATLS